MFLESCHSLLGFSIFLNVTDLTVSLGCILYGILVFLILLMKEMCTKYGLLTIPWKTVLRLWRKEWSRKRVLCAASAEAVGVSLSENWLLKGKKEASTQRGREGKCVAKATLRKKRCWSHSLFLKAEDTFHKKRVTSHYLDTLERCTQGRFHTRQHFFF